MLKKSIQNLMLRLIKQRRKIGEFDYIVEAICRLCGKSYQFDSSVPHREGRLCPHCGISGRGSAIVYHTLRIVYGNATPLPKQSPKKDVKIVGLSDGVVYSVPFAEKFDYCNTYYHKEPYLDICAPGSGYLEVADVVISSEVFEHVIGPVGRAFTGLFDVLKPGGQLILTVPYQNHGDHLEHYPGAVNYEALEQPDGHWIAEIVYKDGSRMLDKSAKFHGGPGKTLEMRLFSRAEVERQLEKAGFVEISFHDENIPEVGIQWGPASRAITAAKPL